MLSFFLSRTHKLYSKEDPFFSMTPVAKEMKGIPIDLYKLGFMFAVENVDPKVGRIEVEFVRTEKRDGERFKDATPIKMV